MNSQTMIQMTKNNTNNNNINKHQQNDKGQHTDTEQS